MGWSLFITVVVYFSSSLWFHPGNKVPPAKGFSKKTPVTFVYQTTGGGIKYTRSGENFAQKSRNFVIHIKNV